MTVMKRKQCESERGPGRESLTGVTFYVGWLFRRAVLPEYWHDLIGMESSALSGWLDDDGLKGLRDCGLLLLHREIGLVPFFREIRYGMLPGLVPPFITALLAEQFRFIGFHPR